MIDFTQIISLDTIKAEAVLEAKFLLTADDIFSAIKVGAVFINGKTYHVPCDMYKLLNPDLFCGDYTKPQLFKLKLTEIKPT